MSNFETRLNQARNGNGVLFCGAGFTADCLNFSPDVTIGTASHLLSVFNDELKKRGETGTYRNIRNAAEAFKESFGEAKLMNLLINRFDIQNVSTDIVEVMRFPWERIYTTNYDNGIEHALRSAGRQHVSINNLDSPTEFTGSLPVIHLHGFVGKWNLENFDKSCILGAESYHRLDAISSWLDVFRRDVERAELVVFVGFSADDFHLNDVLFNVIGAKEKVFFFNRPNAEPDPDIRMTQGRFGEPNYMGRLGLAGTILRVLQSSPPTEPKLANFRRYERLDPEEGLPRVDEIEELFIFGRVNHGQVARDATLRRSDYHVHRSVVDEILTAFEGNTRVVLLLGDICDGKTLVLEDVCNGLSINRPVFRLLQPYEDLLDEVSRILHVYPRAALIIENCFELRQDRLDQLARTFDGSAGLLLLSSRNVSAEAETIPVQRLRGCRDFREYSMGALTDEEVEALIPLVDQIAGWRHLPAYGSRNKKAFIVRECHRSLPAFLLRLLRSDYVRKRYREEYNKTAGLSGPERTAVIAALYVAHIGHTAPLGFLSNALQIDVGGMIHRIDRGQEGLRLLSRHGDYVHTVPAIGARNILEHIILDRDIVDSIVVILQYLAHGRQSDDFERYMFAQMMRYSILRSVVNDRVQINRFFDNISKNEYLRTRVLFWLQWHMAKADMGEFVEAEKYLEQGYAEATNDERRMGRKYNRRQLDDRKAKFLMQRAQRIDRTRGYLHEDMREACQIVSRLLREEELTHHPFETVRDIVETFCAKDEELLEMHREAIGHSIRDLVQRAEGQVQKLPRGSEVNRATKALTDARALLGIGSDVGMKQR